MNGDSLQRWRDSFRSVDRTPGDDWRDAAVHHGLRGFLVLGLAVLIPFLFPRGFLPEFDDLEEGMVANRDVIAAVPFSVDKSEEQLAAERREAESGVASIFYFQPAAADTAASRVRRFFAALDSAAAREREEDIDEGLVAGADTAGIREALERAGVPSPPEGQMIWLANEGNRESLRSALELAFRTFLPQGVAPSADFTEVGSSNVIVRSEDRDRLVPRDSIMRVGDFYQAAVGESPRGLASAGVQLYQTLLVRFVEPSLRLDRDATRQARDQARSAVEASAGYVLEGERIVTAHERIGMAEIEKLQAYETKLREQGLLGGPTSFWRDLGGILHGLVFLLLIGGVLYFFHPELYREVRSFALILGLAFATVAFAGLAARAGVSSSLLFLLVPVAFTALLVGALYDGVLAVVVVLAVAGLMAAQPGFPALEVTFFIVAAGGTAALAVGEVRRRSQSWILISLITGSYVVGGTVLLLLGVSGPLDLLQAAVGGGINATFCTALAMGAALPALESFTDRTSDQTLLELADLNRPLLQRLSREAPGTYAHSVGVANLAEAACLAIGADALRARVGCYYHDIGKMTRPQYFIENQPKGMNPHDRLRPSQSAQVIREHVREGLKLAEEAKLPTVIRDFIREHHGTAKIAYFFARAKEEESELELNPADFCYPGPKPQSKETAVVMLADCVESASRTLSDPTPERVRALVERLMQGRVEEHQLDQSPLTLRDLDVVKNQFCRVLTGLYHRRIDYPGPTSPAAPAVKERRASESAPRTVPTANPTPTPTSSASGG